MIIYHYFNHAGFTQRNVIDGTHIVDRRVIVDFLQVDTVDGHTSFDLFLEELHGFILHGQTHATRIALTLCCYMFTSNVVTVHGSVDTPHSNGKTTTTTLVGHLNDKHTTQKNANRDMIYKVAWSTNLHKFTSRMRLQQPRTAAREA